MKFLQLYLACFAFLIDHGVSQFDSTPSELCVDEAMSLSNKFKTFETNLRGNCTVYTLSLLSRTKINLEEMKKTYAN